uniref:Uncharacterized protein n=1 Tax=Chromera velia CCMP2878 TaxID=1169474 RepID=A0A0G4HJP5_9ALVE|eukprot:Cvel_7109.t1-p1 / transcript=Cvel_7109.t1 / gene=Cvel_7109 / organism=Chromera_velia_CCMP2878 / gene_product=hypothetical protein / transcript_product=hypothetical protein / location=Cvel_scaffold364:32385-46606(-) / protein_length=1621 / sequence_SO=supercontig / SO=protein_coding / is_pseudo=false
MRVADAANLKALNKDVLESSMKVEVMNKQAYDRLIVPSRKMKKGGKINKKAHIGMMEVKEACDEMVEGVLMPMLQMPLNKVFSKSRREYMMIQKGMEYREYTRRLMNKVRSEGVVYIDAHLATEHIAAKADAQQYFQGFQAGRQAHAGVPTKDGLQSTCRHVVFPQHANVSQCAASVVPRRQGTYGMPQSNTTPSIEASQSSAQDLSVPSPTQGGTDKQTLEKTNIEASFCNTSWGGCIAQEGSVINPAAMKSFSPHRLNNMEAPSSPTTPEAENGVVPRSPSLDASLADALDRLEISSSDSLLSSIANTRHLMEWKAEIERKEHQGAMPLHHQMNDLVASALRDQSEGPHLPSPLPRPAESGGSLHPGLEKTRNSLRDSTWGGSIANEAAVVQPVGGKSFSPRKAKNPVSLRIPQTEEAAEDTEREVQDTTPNHPISPDLVSALDKLEISSSDSILSSLANTRGRLVTDSEEESRVSSAEESIAEKSAPPPAKRKAAPPPIPILPAELVKLSMAPSDVLRSEHASSWQSQASRDLSLSIDSGRGSMEEESATLPPTPSLQDLPVSVSSSVHLGDASKETELGEAYRPEGEGERKKEEEILENEMEDDRRDFQTTTQDENTRPEGTDEAEDKVAASEEDIETQEQTKESEEHTEEDERPHTPFDDPLPSSLSSLEGSSQSSQQRIRVNLSSSLSPLGPEESGCDSPPERPTALDNMSVASSFAIPSGRVSAWEDSRIFTIENTREEIDAALRLSNKDDNQSEEEEKKEEEEDQRGNSDEEIHRGPLEGAQSDSSQPKLGLSRPLLAEQLKLLVDSPPERPVELDNMSVASSFAIPSGRVSAWEDSRIFTMGNAREEVDAALRQPMEEEEAERKEDPQIADVEEEPDDDGDDQATPREPTHPPNQPLLFEGAEIDVEQAPERPIELDNMSVASSFAIPSGRVSAWEDSRMFSSDDGGCWEEIDLALGKSIQKRPPVYGRADLPPEEQMVSNTVMAPLTRPLAASRPDFSVDSPPERPVELDNMSVASSFAIPSGRVSAWEDSRIFTMGNAREDIDAALRNSNSDRVVVRGRANTQPADQEEDGDATKRQLKTKVPSTLFANTPESFVDSPPERPTALDNMSVASSFAIPSGRVSAWEDSGIFTRQKQPDRRKAGDTTQMKFGNTELYSRGPKTLQPPSSPCPLLDPPERPSDLENMSVASSFSIPSGRVSTWESGDGESEDGVFTIEQAREEINRGLRKYMEDEDREKEREREAFAHTKNEDNRGPSDQKDLMDTQKLKVSTHTSESRIECSQSISSVLFFRDGLWYSFLSYKNGTTAKAPRKEASEKETNRAICEEVEKDFLTSFGASTSGGKDKGRGAAGKVENKPSQAQQSEGRSSDAREANEDGESFLLSENERKMKILHDAVDRARQAEVENRNKAESLRRAAQEAMMRGQMQNVYFDYDGGGFKIRTREEIEALSADFKKEQERQITSPSPHNNDHLRQGQWKMPFLPPEAPHRTWGGIPMPPKFKKGSEGKRQKKDKGQREEDEETYLEAAGLGFLGDLIAPYRPRPNFAPSALCARPPGKHIRRLDSIDRSCRSSVASSCTEVTEVALVEEEDEHMKACRDCGQAFVAFFLGDL